jgi:hypothetical protein
VFRLPPVGSVDREKVADAARHPTAPPPTMDAAFDRLGLPLIDRAANDAAAAGQPPPPPLVIYNNRVTDSQIVGGLITNAALGAACLAGFAALRGAVPFYTARLRLASVLVRPPPQPGLGSLRQAWEWVGPTLATPDADLARSAGLDALVTHRVLTFGVLFFFPVCFLFLCWCGFVCVGVGGWGGVGRGGDGGRERGGKRAPHEHTTHTHT